jgi:hypothetical protein
MTDFFDGVRLYAPIVLRRRGRDFTCRIKEQWHHLDEDLISLCGAPVENEVTFKRGLSRRDYRSLERTLGGSLGSKDVAQFAAGLKETTGSEISWTVEETRRQKVQAKAPECGSQRCAVWQLHRTYVWSRERRFLKMFGPVVREHSERTRNTTVIYHTEQIDPQCRCEPKEKTRLSNLVDAFIENLQLVLPGYDTGTAGVEAAIGNLPIHAPPYGQSNLQVSAGELPPWVASLAGVEAEAQVAVIVRLHRRERYEIPAPVAVPVEVEIERPVYGRPAPA